MLDLSNNNAVGHNFRVAYLKGGQRRVYLKAAEGTHFTDRTYSALRRQALAAHLHVGAYGFLHPLQATPVEAADYLLRLLPNPLVRGRDLRPALDAEWVEVKPGPKVGAWYEACAKHVRYEIGVRPLVYGSGWYLQACGFAKPPGPLWLAAYGKDDGREYPVGRLPRPWRVLTAHQYTSEARVLGINGHCDLSHVFVPGNIELPPSFAT